MPLPEIHLSRPAVALPDTVVTNDEVVSRVQDCKQKTHASSHHYSPEEFGLTAERIHADLGGEFETFAKPLE